MASQGPIEVALSTDLRGAPYSFSLWDIHTGAQLVTFKGNTGNPISRCLHLINQNYFITAIDNVLQIWSIYNKKPQDQKLFLPGRPSCLCASPCGNYLMVGISEMIYIWQLNSGNLLAHTQRHYQTVTVLRMNHDGTFLFSGGEDGMVLVWPFADLISNTHHLGALGLTQARADAGVNEPRFSWQHHDAPITDIHISNSGLCVTTSSDKTVNIYSYARGERLDCISNWPSPISCVVMNKNCTRMFLGGQDGNIYQFAMVSIGQPLISSKGKDEEGCRKPMLTGHKDRISQLLLSTDGTLLISGSHDSTCKVWDVVTKKMLRDIKHQAPLSNLVSFLVPESFSLTSMTQSKMKPPLLVKPLKRNIYKLPDDRTISTSDLFDEGKTTIVNIRNDTDLFDKYKSQLLPKQIPENLVKNGAQPGSSELVISDQTNDDVRSLQTRLRELYLLSVEKIFQDVANQSLQPYKALVDEIDRTIPRESKKEKQKKKKKLLKRKGVESDGDSQIGASTSAKAKSKPSTNGIKKVKKRSDMSDAIM